MQEAPRCRIHFDQNLGIDFCGRQYLLLDNTNLNDSAFPHSCHQNSHLSSCIELRQDRLLSISFCPLHIPPLASTDGKTLGNLDDSPSLHLCISKHRSRTASGRLLPTIWLPHTRRSTMITRVDEMVHTLQREPREAIMEEHTLGQMCNQGHIPCTTNLLLLQLQVCDRKYTHRLSILSLPVQCPPTR